MVLFCEEKACLLESLAVESVGVFEDLTHTLHAYMLSKDLFALLLEGVHIEAVGELITKVERLVKAINGILTERSS